MKQSDAGSRRHPRCCCSARLQEALVGRFGAHHGLLVGEMLARMDATIERLSAGVSHVIHSIGELMDVEVTQLAGPKGTHDPARVAMRHGSQPGNAPLPVRLEPVGSQVEQAARGTSKSSVSRRFVAATAVFGPKALMQRCRQHKER